jgi:hypothetical protein
MELKSFSFMININTIADVKHISPTFKIPSHVFKYHPPYFIMNKMLDVILSDFF